MSLIKLLQNQIIAPMLSEILDGSLFNVVIMFLS